MLTQLGEFIPGIIAPVARMGENVVVKRVQSYFLYNVIAVEPIPGGGQNVVNLLANAVPAAASIASQATLQGVILQTPMEMDGYELGQFRMEILDPFALAVYEPSALPRYITKTSRGRISSIGQANDPDRHLSELFVWQDEWPAVDIINPTGYTLVNCRVQFFGFRYRLARATQNNNGQIQPIPAQATPMGFGNIPYTGIMAEGFVGTGFERAYN